jgi:peptidase E
LAKRPQPRVCFVPTASGDAATYLVKFYRAFSRLSCIPSDLTFFGSPALPRNPSATDQLRAFALEQDVIYVGGGNTANMLATWRVHGFDAVLREAWESGVVLSGVSAGAICWFESGITDSFGPHLAALRDGLGFLPGSACPHYDGESERRPAYQRFVGDGLAPGLAADDGVALRFAGTTLTEVVASRSGAHAYRVDKVDGGIIETKIDARLLVT